MDKGKKRAKRFTGILGNLMFWVVFAVIFAAAFSLSSGGSFSFFGYRLFDVVTGSMEPAYMPGDMIIVKSTPPDEIKIGDAVTFRTTADENVFLTHRVVEIINGEKLGFITKGDNNNAVDSFTVNADAVVGRVVANFAGMGVIVRFFHFAAKRWYIFIPAFIVLECLVETIVSIFKDEGNTDEIND